MYFWWSKVSLVKLLPIWNFTYNFFILYKACLNLALDLMNKKFVLGDNLLEKLKDLPIKPGVYRFLDANKTILYIGKAKNLRARIKSYFQANTKKTKKLNKLLKESYSLDLTLTNSELEALLLEQHLIKQLKPRF